jgi:DNA-binding LacI/PurR family transcriptional regulator
MGRQAADALIARIENPSIPPFREVVPVELIARQSTLGR